LRVGVARQFFFDDVDASIAARVEDAIRALTAIVRTVRDVEIPVDTDRTVSTFEAYQYHAKWAAETPNAYQPETLRRILAGRDISEEQYRRKLADLHTMRAAARDMFRDIDVLITPTSPVLPARIVDLESAPAELRAREILMLRNTRPFNMWCIPTISVPCGKTAEGLPVGLQISGAPGADPVVLSLAHALHDQAR
jgi:aspartyl-tRNA(Asn)/glutamyl-tRNA(Gln) amidotransferase subunit A